MRAPAPLPPAPALLDAVPDALARAALALPVRLEGHVLHVRSLTGDDADPDLDAMRVEVGAADVVATRDPDVVRHLLVAYARHRLTAALDDPVLLLDLVLDLAAGSDASDVHLETDVDGMRVRQRVDGELHDVLRVPPRTVSALVARTKVRASLDVAERRLPQDGRLIHVLPDGTLDVRVATMPVQCGERVTLRLLPDGPSGPGLDGLGLPEDVVAGLDRAARVSEGLVIVCGPTGSGKTTTLHALLARLVATGRNVMTLEDPVERTVRGASQTQVAPDIDLTFARGLRHLLRHDPDVLLVGEVRDRETAELAVEAARTGHLVLTSLHAVEAPGALARLHELGVDGTSMADTVRLVVAQRLLALPCPDCAPVMDGDAPNGPGCAACAGTGTRGRSAVAERLELSNELRTLLRDGHGPGAHHAALAAAVAPRLREVALARAEQGQARSDDALRTTPDPDA